MSLDCPKADKKLGAKPAAASLYVSVMQCKRAISRGADVRYVFAIHEPDSSGVNVAAMGVGSAAAAQ